MKQNTNALVKDRTTETVPEKNAPSSGGRQTLRKIEPYLWMLPSILLMAVMILIPILTVFRLSAMEISRAGIVKGFNNFANYKEVLTSPIFRHTLWNTLVWTVVVVGVSTLIGFVLAMVLNQNFRGRKFVRALVIFPWATSLIIQAVIWKYIISADYGSLNVILSKLGLIDQFINWTSSAAAFFAWECWVGVFVTVPFVTFCVLSGLQSIDDTYYEAAEMDGAGFWKKLFSVTLPLVRPSLTVSTVLNIIYVFNSFPIVWTISKGDPADKTHTLVTYLYKLSFTSGKSGLAAAVSVIGFVILAICASVYMILSLKGEEEGS
ncbi:MAG: sugar ABC transporter permease [Oscillibacter sp.]|jgi:multiple sugar transport system permease protein|nr:sugar ABC transporter permease [Oscillibacter sp.]MCI8690037.1 sugar ABC transporter permease [Oscillibacter sp.]MCI9481939.1 sugar ABC transporter permease [Oscillibacter sp.]